MGILVNDTKKIYKHFNFTEQKMRNYKFTLRKDGKSEIKAAFIETGEESKETTVPPENMRLVYFTKKGCQD